MFRVFWLLYLFLQLFSYRFLRFWKWDATITWMLWAFPTHCSPCVLPPQSHSLFCQPCPHASDGCCLRWACKLLTLELMLSFAFSFYTIETNYMPQWLKGTGSSWESTNDLDTFREFHRFPDTRPALKFKMLFCQVRMLLVVRKDQELL